MISLTPADVEQRFAKLGIPNRFTPSELRSFETIGVVGDAQVSAVAFPVPHDNTGLNILNLRRIIGTDPARPPSFFDHPWYLEEAFAARDCRPGWHIIQPEVSADTISQPITYIHSLSARGLALPEAIEICLMLFLHYAGTGEQLLHKKHTWCSDEARLDRFVTVGAFGRNGLFISAHPPTFASRGLGICGKFKRVPRDESSG
jgi:hypothetical protein